MRRNETNRVHNFWEAEVTALEPVVISALNQYVFCPRRCALMHVEGIWSDNAHTTLGPLLHDHTDEPGYETDGNVTLLRALPLYSSRYGLVGKADMIEMRACVPIPVEYKKGKRRQFENDDIQLCAQALCLEDMFGVAIMAGCIYHAASKRRRKVMFDAQLRCETLQTIDAVRRLLTVSHVPPAVLTPRCNGCSLRDVCLPELTGADASVARQEEYQRHLCGEA
jgi:CRISPR-associated exonuclease Cas4